MSQPRVIPVLLLKNAGLVKTVKFDNPKYVGDPINAVRIFNEKEVDELVFLDIEAGKTGKEPDFDYIESIATECFMPFSYGGGIQTIDHIRRIIKLGAEKIILNSAAFDNSGLIAEAAVQFGQQSVVVAVDVKKNLWGKYDIYSCGGTRKIKTPLAEWIETVQSLGAGEIILNSIDRDGTMTGYDLKLYEQVRDIANVPVVACGGAGKPDDFKDVLATGGANAVAAGSFFVFHGKHRAVLITYPKYQDLKSLFAT